MITIYTDGSCIHNGKSFARSSWAIYHVEEKNLISGVVPYTEPQTNNVGELMAIKKALLLIMYLGEDRGKIITDSMYCIKSLTEWDIEKRKKGGAKKSNYDLIKNIQSMLDRIYIQFEWVKGHSLDPYNDLVDEAARAEIT